MTELLSDGQPGDVETEEDLRSLYAPPSQRALDKVLPQLCKHSRRFLELSPFFCIGTSQPSGLGDVSPRGGEPGFVHALDDTHIAFPDRPGNNRLDTLDNILRQPAVGLLFFLPGLEEMLRINGLAAVSTREDLMQRFLHDGKRPRSVIVIETREVYFHCSKAVRRSELWNPEKRIPKGGFPTLGQISRDRLKLETPAGAIDLDLQEDAKTNLY